MRSYRYLLLVVALVLCLDLVAGARYPVAARQDVGDSSVESKPTSKEQSEAPSRSQSTDESPEETQHTSRSAKASQSPTPTEPPSSATNAANAVPVTTASNEPLPSSTVAPGKDALPIQPKITPAMGLSGVILLISGAVYTVIGIKNKWLYVFSSTAYLTSLAVSVLIVYLMSPPVTDAVQGAFFVAAFFTGIIFGGLSLVFSDITDGLGCLLGGFCLSMWFLSLKEGGLIASATGRAIFISVMSFAGFSLSFSHYTRNHGLIVSISFSGATITMLGIDCLSCAGWKEFWLYLWDLNQNIFPLNTNTYPITRGIKVEIACVVIICMLGIVSQLRLWKLVKERREKSAAIRLERDQNQEREEEELGRRIEDNFSKERARWEATYGDKSSQVGSPIESSSNSIPKSSVSIREKGLSDGVEMVKMSTTQNGGVQRDGSRRSAKHASVTPTVTVTVLRDDDIQEIDEEGNPIAPQKSSARQSIHGKANSLRNSSGPVVPQSNEASQPLSARSSVRLSVTPAPKVVPLPFTVPNEDDTQSHDDRASVSAVPESIHSAVTNPRPLSKRISEAALKRISANRLSRSNSDSEEALIIPHIEDDRASSVAATLDEENDFSSLPALSPPHSPLMPAHPESRSLSPLEMERDSLMPHDEGSTLAPVTLPGAGLGLADISEAGPGESEKHSQIPPPAADQVPKSLTTSTDPKPETTRSRRTSLGRHSDTVGSVNKDDSQRTKSTKSGAASQSSRTESNGEGLVASMLPDKLSKIAMSYRTNEWAKHLETAEKPHEEEVPEPGSPGIKVETQSDERPAPIKSATVGSQPAVRGKAKRASTESYVYRNSNPVRSSADMTKAAQADALQALTRKASNTPVPTTAFLPGGVSRSGSAAQNRGIRSSSTPYLAATTLESPIEQPTQARVSPVPSPMPSNTLMSQRDALVRNKVTSQSLTPNSSTPNLMAAGDAENLTLAQRKQLIQHQKPPSAGQPWRQSGWANSSPQPQIYDSHQPRRLSGGPSQDRREMMLANWREGIRHDTAPAQSTVVDEQARRAAMINDRRQKEAAKQQQEAAMQHRDSVMNNMMRSGEMLDAHREAMRRMQAKANRTASG
ncbi:hypothetical protein EJ04DRAFT_138868 [Polyplosphaeria fusca]|uniref:TM7S3/TM198-like domain-containing protein n=1 Tax=Polyplosphaeria fusca TaxID=682080 RepID=A0A9P4R532_9PLEO|nr:hypothetical protein EJ04DRAFT_138868 [Polyplosphaeria fusca]